MRCAQEAVNTIASHSQPAHVLRASASCTEPRLNCAVIHDMPTSGHNGSDSFAALIEEWPEYGVAARQGYDAFFRLLGDRNVNATSLERLDPHIVHDGASVPVASVDSCVRDARAALSRSGACRRSWPRSSRRERIGSSSVRGAPYMPELMSAGEPRRCGRHSSYSGEIVQLRAAASKSQIVDYFPSAFPRNAKEAQMAYS